MASSGVTIEGFAELDRKFEALERGVTPEQAAPALKAGGKIIGDEERALVPRRTGQLASSIVEEMYPSNSADWKQGALTGDGMTIYIAPTLKRGWYGYMVEMGLGEGGPHPFARPAVDNKGESAMHVTAEMLGAHIVSIAKS